MAVAITSFPNAAAMNGHLAEIARTLAPGAHAMLLLDDCGPGCRTAGQRPDLMEIVADRHGRRSILITSQLPATTWHDVIDEPAFASAILNRLVHNAHRLEPDSHSVRGSGSRLEKVDEGQGA